MRKRCVLCHKSRELKFFNKNAARADELQSACRDCNKEKSRAYYYSNVEKHKAAVLANKQRRIKENQERIREYLLAHPCIDCGESDLIVLEFDHIKGQKLGNVCAMMQDACSWTKISAEIEKCEVRCANCHRRKTASRAGYHSWRAPNMRSKGSKL
jgi:hypothetical protein